jgi:PhnB protein
MHVQPYLFFDGRAQDAIDFYKDAVGAQVTALMRFGESPDQSHVAPENKNKVMHGSFKVGDTDILISDGENKGAPKFDGFSLTIQCKDAAEAERYFKALSAGGAVTLPLSKTFFARNFGMLRDKFGVHWMVIAA